MGSTSLVFQCFCLALLLGTPDKVQGQLKQFDVTQSGAKADGITDDSVVFSDVWNQCCQNGGGGVILFPKGRTYLVNPVVLKGPCKGPIELQIQGTLKAAVDKKACFNIDHWITFHRVQNLVIRGGGMLDGQGASTWGKRKNVPTTLRLDFVSGGSIDHITILNSKNTHINLFSCDALTISNINLTSPGSSPNTDGIKVANSNNIQILDSYLATGDDCIAFLPDSMNVNVTNVHCGPGHGVSIGSLSSGNITNLNVRNCSFVGTQNGVRIKTKGISTPGQVSHITFQDIHMDKAGFPILIDQNYCPGHDCKSISSQIQVSNIKYTNIWGTSISEKAVTFNCSRSNPCQGIELTDINLTYDGKGGPAKSTCSNVKVEVSGIQNPPACP